MKEFWFLNPTKVIFGNNKLETLGEVVKPFGPVVLLVYGQRSFRASGLHARTLCLLRASGLTVVEHGGVKSNPIVSHVREGVALAKREGANCVLAVGGGSVIDAAKAIACGAMADTDVWSFFAGGARPQKALPIIAVATIAASASEMNSGAVLTDETTGRKASIGALCLAPAVSILDPTLTLSVPRQETAHGLVDAFSHVMEGFFNGESDGTSVQDEMAAGVMRSLIGISGRVLADLRNIDSRAEAMWAVCVAHNGWLTAGRGKIVYELHIMAHTIGGMFDTPHGVTMGIVIPAWMTFRFGVKQDRLARFAEQVMSVAPEQSREAVAAEGIRETRRWIAGMGAPLTLGDLGIERSRAGDILASYRPVAAAAGLSEADGGRMHNFVDLLWENSMLN